MTLLLVNTMVVYKNREGDDIEERSVTTWWTRSRYVTFLSVAVCLLTSLAVVTTLLVTLILTKQDQGNCQFVFR